MANHAQKFDARPTLITLMLREDHQKVRQLFDQFHKTTNAHEKRDIVTAALASLEVLAKLKEELIYPAWREHVNEQNLMDEALKEHQIVYVLIKELKNMDPEDKRLDTRKTGKSFKQSPRTLGERRRAPPASPDNGCGRSREKWQRPKQFRGR